MDDAERQRTMDFILRQQAQFAAGMHRLEEADARASTRLDRLERTVVLMARQFRRERRDLRERIAALVDEHFDLRPGAFRQELDLHRPIYQKTAAYGHFGREDHDFTWERTDKAEALRDAAGLAEAGSIA